MMGKINRLLVLALFLAACAPAAEPTPTPTPRATVTLVPTHTPTSTPSPTPVPTPLGGGGYPLLAVVLTNFVGQTAVSEIEIVELETERVLARIPINRGGTTWDESRQAFFSDVFSTPVLSFSADGHKLAYNDIVDDKMTLLLYDLETGETQTLLTRPGDSAITDIQWSFDGSWISYLYWDASRLSKLNIYSLERGSASFVSSAYWMDWYPEDNRIMYQNAGGSRLVLNVETGIESRAPSFSTSSSYFRSYHDADISNWGCGICFIPKLGLLEKWSSTRDKLTEFHDLIDPETREIVFSAVYERPNTNARLRILDVLSLGSNNYLVYALTGNLYSVWNPESNGKLDINEDSTLQGVMPLAVSRDGHSFVALVLEQSFLPRSVSIFDIGTGEVLYEYRRIGGGGQVFNYDELKGIDVVWPSDP